MEPLEIHDRVFLKSVTSSEYACMEENIKADGNHSYCHPFCVLNTWQPTTESNVIIQHTEPDTKYQI